MNIFCLGAVLGVFMGATGGFLPFYPYGVFWRLLAAVVCGAVGFFVGHFCGFLVLLPFEGLARLCRFITTGRWTDPALYLKRFPKPSAAQPNPALQRTPTAGSAGSVDDTHTPQ